MLFTKKLEYLSRKLLFAPYIDGKEKEIIIDFFLYSNGMDWIDI